MTAQTYQDPLKDTEGLTEEVFTATDPIKLFLEWYELAKARELNDADAMAVATANSSGLPNVRILLLKGIDERGFVFYTNQESVKGGELGANPQAALNFHWKSIRRQVRVRGPVTPVSQEESDAYFASRSRGSRVGAWASNQSRPVGSREELAEFVSAKEAEFEGRDVPRPPHWGGYRVTPAYVEFWREQPYRLHDRLSFRRAGDAWEKQRLFP